MLMEKIRGDLKTGMKTGDVILKSITRVVLGELDRLKPPITDDVVIKSVKKLLENNQETLKMLEGKNEGVFGENKFRYSVLNQENQYLESLLPKMLTLDEISDRIRIISDEIRNAKSEGQAIGIAIKYLKSFGNPEPTMVKSVIQSIRQ